MLRKMGQNYQLAIPKEIIKTLHLNVDDYLDIRIEGNKIVIEPQIVIPKDQAYFYTAEWQKEEAKARDDLKKGDVTKTQNLKELFKKLDR